MMRLENDQLVKTFTNYLQVEKGLAPGSIASYRADVVQFGEFLAGRPIITASVEDLRNYMAHLLSLVQTSSVARKHSSLRNLFRFLLADGLIARNPMTQVPAPKSESKLPDWLTNEEVHAVFDHLRKENRYQHRYYGAALRARDLAMIALMDASGIRVSELTGVKLADLNLKAGYLRVFGKGSKERIAPFGRVAREALEDYLRQRQQLVQPLIQGAHDWCIVFWKNAELRRIHLAPSSRTRAFAAKLAAEVLKEGWEDAPWLFVSGPGKGRITRQWVWRIVAECSAVVGRKIHPHTFRHTCGSALSRGGANPRVIQEVLGHAEIDTSEIYIHLDPEATRRALQFHPRQSRRYDQAKLPLETTDDTVGILSPFPSPTKLTGYIKCYQCNRPVAFEKSNSFCEEHLVKHRKAVRRYYVRTHPNARIGVRGRPRLDMT